VAVAAAGVTTAATGVAYVLSHAGNEPLPAGVHQVEIYTVEDDISTVVPAADRPGAVGRFIGMCDADSYYMEVDGSGLCVVLNGSLGTVPATGTAQGVKLDAATAARVRDIVRRDDAGNQQQSTRVVLGYDGGWAGMIRVADLTGPVTASPVG
jgi:hypothetical protein